MQLRRLVFPLVIVGVAGIGCEPEVPIGPAWSPQTSRLGISEDGATLFVALADHDLVRAVSSDDGRQLGEVQVVGHPHRLTVMSDGRVAVTARYAGTVSIVDVLAGRTDATVDVGSDPHGVIELDGQLVVAVSGDDDLALIDLANPTQVASRIVVGDDPRGLARSDDGKLVVSHFSAGVLSVVEGGVVRDVDMKLPSKRFFFPNQMDTITIQSTTGELQVPHVECNNDPAQFGAGGTTLAGSGTTVEYYVMGPTGYPAVNPAVSAVDIDSELLLSDETRTFEESAGQVPEQPGPAAPVVNPLNRVLLDTENMNAPVAVAVVDGGNLQLVVNRGSGNVVVRRPTLLSGQSSLIGHVNVGVGAEAIQVSPNGATAYVYNSFNDTITKFAVPQHRRQQSQFDGERGSGQVFVERAEPFEPVRAEDRFVVADPVLPPDVLRGRELFHSVGTELTTMGAISCNSCHPGGGDDSTTWAFAEGPRQSPALWGGILGTEPFHWDQAVVNMADISRVTIQGRMGGTGLSPADMNRIGAFLDTIPAPAPPSVRASAGDPNRGAEVFYSTAANCASCHAGANFTDNRSHNVFTGSEYSTRETASEFATPVLHGLAHSGPYLHDGSARTLSDVVSRLVATGRMGNNGLDLSEQDLVDLVAFLETL